MAVFLRRLLVALLLGVLVYGAFAVSTGLSALGNALDDFAWWTFLLALGLACFNYVLRFLKWEYYLRRVGVGKIPRLDSFLVFLSGFVLTVTPGKVGEVLQKTHGVDAAKTAPILVAERLTDVIAIVVLVLLGSLGFPGGLSWALLGIAVVVLGLVLILWDAPADRLMAAIRSRGGRLGAALPRLATARASLKIVARPQTLVIPTLLSIVGWGAEGIALWFLLRGFAQAVPELLAVFFYATATLAGALIPVPGGLGVTETIMQTQLVGLAAVEKGAATGAMLLIRFATLWWAVLVGFAALFALRLRFPQVLGPRPAQRPSTEPRD